MITYDDTPILNEIFTQIFSFLFYTRNKNHIFLFYEQNNKHRAGINEPGNEAYLTPI